MEAQTLLYGLVLSGGQSSRMGSDKGLLEYHGIPQRNYLFDLLSKFCEKTFYSVRIDQSDSFPKNAPLIIDRDEYRGPLNGIMSAHGQFPEAAWLVVACDLPLLAASNIETLIKERNPKMDATAFATTASGLPEPLIAIWEPTALQKIPAYMKIAKSSCARKFLINSSVHLIHPEKDEQLFNANSLEEFKTAKSILD